MNILVIGGTGTVGSEVVNGLLNLGRDNLNIRIMTRSREKIPGLPEGTEGVIGDLNKTGTLEKAFRGVDRLFFVTTPESEDETQSGLNAVEAAQEADIEKIVYMSAYNLEAFTDTPHFIGKIPVEEAVKSSGLAYTLLRPNEFFQNDYWFKEGILKHGVYGQPMGNIGLNRVDVRDVADAAVNALLSDELNGKTYPLVGADVLDADKTVALFSKYLEREITYTGDDIETWAEHQRKYLPERIVRDIRAMYEHFLEHGYLASEEALAQTREILGREPRSYEAFVKEITAQWKQEQEVVIS